MFLVILIYVPLLILDSLIGTLNNDSLYTLPVLAQSQQKSKFI